MALPLILSTLSKSPLTALLSTISFPLPTFHLPLPTLPTLPQIWDSLLRAVPKKKTSHMKKRHRQLAGKALPVLTNLNKCPACGRIKRSHTLCEHCVASIKNLWRKDAKNGSETSEEF